MDKEKILKLIKHMRGLKDKLKSLKEENKKLEKELDKYKTKKKEKRDDSKPLFRSKKDIGMDIFKKFR